MCVSPSWQTKLTRRDEINNHVEREKGTHKRQWEMVAQHYGLIEVSLAHHSVPAQWFIG